MAHVYEKERLCGRFAQFPVVIDGALTSIPALDALQQFGLLKKESGRRNKDMGRDFTDGILERLDHIVEEARSRAIMTSWASVPFILALDFFTWYCLLVLRRSNGRNITHSVAEEFEFAADTAGFYRRVLARRFSSFDSPYFCTRAILSEMHCDVSRREKLDSPRQYRGLLGSLIQQSATYDGYCCERSQMMICTAVDSSRLDLVNLELLRDPTMETLGDITHLMSQDISNKQYNAIDNLVGCPSWEREQQVAGRGEHKALALAFRLQDYRATRRLLCGENNTHFVFTPAILHTAVTEWSTAKRAVLELLRIRGSLALKSSEIEAFEDVVRQCKIQGLPMMTELVKDPWASIPVAGGILSAVLAEGDLSYTKVFEAVKAPACLLNQMLLSFFKGCIPYGNEARQIAVLVSTGGRLEIRIALKRGVLSGAAYIAEPDTLRRTWLFGDHVIVITREILLKELDGDKFPVEQIEPMLQRMSTYGLPLDLTGKFLKGMTFDLPPRSLCGILAVLGVPLVALRRHL
jgi:hypothetical protein